jgi:hypothetical protein
VKRQSFDKVSLCFGFKTGEIVMAEGLISLPVPLTYRLQHFLIELNELFVACCVHGCLVLFGASVASAACAGACSRFYSYP